MRSAISHIISFVFLIWFIASVGCMIIFAKQPEKAWLVPMIFGQFFVVIGIAGVIAAVASKSAVWQLPALALIVGAAVMVIEGLYHYGDDAVKEKIVSLIPTLAGAGFIIFGIIEIAAAASGGYFAKLKYTTPIEGRCVGFKARGGKGGHISKCPVYEITLDGEVKKLENNVYSNIALPAVGEVRTLYINEQDLSSYSEPVADSKQRLFSYILFSLFVIAGIIIFLVTL